MSRNERKRLTVMAAVKQEELTLVQASHGSLLHRACQLERPRPAEILATIHEQRVQRDSQKAIGDAGRLHDFAGNRSLNVLK